MNPEKHVYFEELLKYAILLFKEQDWHTAGFYAAAAFESCIAPRGGYDDSYSKRVERTLGLSLVKQAMLRDCIDFRNKAIHENLYGDNRTQYIDNLIKTLCATYEIDRDKVLNDFDYEDIKALQRKFVGGKDADVLHGFKGLFNGFTNDDFRNLYEMRNKIYYLMAELTDFCQGLTPQLYFDSISKTISSYVWLAAVQNLDCERPKISYPSLSILATNVDIRVYLDFGGRCKNERKKYYKLLLSKKGLETLKNLDNEFSIFDIYWYFNIENKVSLQHFYERRFFTHDGHIEDEIDEIIQKFEDDIDSKKTIPDNKMLLGKIYSKESVIERGRDFIDDVKTTYIKLLPILNSIQGSKSKRNKL